MTVYSWVGRRTRLKKPRPYPVDDLARAMGLHPPKLTHQLTLALGMCRGWVLRCRQVGLTFDQADDWANRAGLHPSNVWPDWGQEITDPCCDSYECTCDAQEAM